MNVRRVHSKDRSEWLRMRALLWPGSLDDHPVEINAQLGQDDEAGVVFVLDRDKGDRNPELGGFLEISLRSHAEGCTNSPVAYLEGWWVDEDLRSQHVGASLVEAAERWARARGVTEMASDAELSNEGSIGAHAALGFREHGRIVCFHKQLR